MAINALDYYWDPVTWLFPLVPLIPLVLEGVLEQQIEVILICLGWEGEMWLSQLVKLRSPHCSLPLRTDQNHLNLLL